MERESGFRLVLRIFRLVRREEDEGNLWDADGDTAGMADGKISGSLEYCCTGTVREGTTIIIRLSIRS